MNRILAGFAPGEFENSFFLFSVFWGKKNTQDASMSFGHQIKTTAPVQTRENQLRTQAIFMFEVCFAFIVSLDFSNTPCPKYTGRNGADSSLVPLIMYIKTARFLKAMELDLVCIAAIFFQTGPVFGSHAPCHVTSWRRDSQGFF